ncbi:MAG: TIGR01906 family membrane protein [Anaerolineae bacterium]
MRSGERVLSLLLILTLPVFLMLTNLYLFVSPGFLRYEYGKRDLPPALSFSPAERLSIAETAVHYLRSDADVDLLGDLKGEEGPFFSERELVHMVDVKRVMKGAFMAHRLCGSVTAVAIVALCLRAETRKRVPFYIFLSCSILLFILILMAAIIYLNFDLLFVGFHRVFFEGDSWRFALTDTLIQLFPPQFWVDVSLQWAFLTLAEALILGLAMLGLMVKISH